MRNKRVLLFLIMCILCVCWGCSSNKDREALPKLVIGCDTLHPYSYVDEDGNPAGMDVDLAKEACKRMGYEPEFVYIDWDERDTLLANGDIDCLWSCFSMDGQVDSYAWVGPYMYSRQVIAVKADSPITHLSDLKDIRVAVRVGAKAETILMKQENAEVPNVQNVFSLDNMSDVVTALRNDYVDACAGYAAALRDQLQNDSVNYRFLDDDLDYAKIGVAFLKNGDTTIRNKLRDTLDAMQADGTTERILKSYGVDTDKVLRRCGNE